MEQLITIGLIEIGDQIKFIFKKNAIYGTIGHGGHVLNTIIQSPNMTEIKTLFTRTYPSLTAWSEACLREGLQEENTRYASWKRVIHVRSGRTLQSLRSQLNVSTKMVGASRQDLFAEINRFADESRPVEPAESQTKRQCTHHRSASYDALRDKVLQGVGGDLIAPWLTPLDLLSVKRAFPCNWRWSATWHGGRVTDKEVAAKLVVHVKNRMSIYDMKRLYTADKVFCALEYILNYGDFVQAAYQYCHYKSIRKIERLMS